jgi:DNA (cytosine-5)-methyltransferase 1
MFTLQAKQQHAVLPDVADCLQERDAKGADSSTKNGHLIPVAFGYQNDGDTMMGMTKGGVPTLSASTRMAVAFDTTQITNPENRCNPKDGDPCHPLSASAHPPAIAFSGRERGAEPSCGRPPRPPHAIEEAVGALDTVKPWNVATGYAVRRLTPRECDRLMGWPEDHTAGFPDTVRYRMAGNGVASPCSEWIGKRIVRLAT